MQLDAFSCKSTGKLLENYCNTLVHIVHKVRCDSALAALDRVIQKVRLASPETFAEVQKELQAPLKECCDCYILLQDVKCQKYVCERDDGGFFLSAFCLTQEILEVELENTGSQKERIKEARTARTKQL